MQNLISRTLLASALYTINKQAKKLRDRRENAKTTLYQSYEDEYGHEHRGLLDALNSYEFCGEKYTCDDCDNSDCDNDDHSHSYCTNEYEACAYCADAYEKLKELKNELYTLMETLKQDITEIYHLKETILEKTFTPCEIHEFRDGYRLFYKYGIYSFHSDLVDTDDYKLPITRKIDYEISSTTEEEKVNKYEGIKTMIIQSRKNNEIDDKEHNTLLVNIANALVGDTNEE